MGRRWKPPKQPKDIVDMIEHTITKYEPPPPAKVSYLPVARSLMSQPPSTRTTWPHKKCLEYVEELKQRGFVQGAAVITSYGNPGTINNIREIPIEGLSFFGVSFPNIFSILRPLMGDSGVWYNESELTLNQE